MIVTLRQIWTDERYKSYVDLSALFSLTTDRFEPLVLKDDVPYDTRGKRGDSEKSLGIPYGDMCIKVMVRNSCNNYVI